MTISNEFKPHVTRDASIALVPDAKEFTTPVKPKVTRRPLAPRKDRPQEWVVDD